MCNVLNWHDNAFRPLTEVTSNSGCSGCKVQTVPIDFDKAGVLVSLAVD